MASAAHGDDDGFRGTLGKVGAGLRLLAPRGSAEAKHED